MRIVGLDVGQRSLGLAVLEDDSVYSIAYYAENTFLSRLNTALEVFKSLGPEKVDLYVIEEYAKMSFSHVAFGMGENGGICRTIISRQPESMLLCPVPSMRGFFSLKTGSSGKTQLRIILKDIFPTHTLTSTEKKRQDDEVDALGYALIGKAFMQPDKFDLTDKQKEVLKKLRENYYIGEDAYA